jgi:hypothetical protein
MDGGLPADFSSKPLVNTVSWNPKQLQKDQENDLLIRHLKQYLLHQELPQDNHLQYLTWLSKKVTFIGDGLVWRSIKRQLRPS